MDKETMLKLAEVLTDEQFEELFDGEGLTKEAEADMVLGEIAAEGFVDEMQKISELLEQETDEDAEIEKIAEEYDTAGRQLAWEYVEEMLKEAEEALDPVNEEDEEGKKKKKKKKDEDEDEEKEQVKEALYDLMEKAGVFSSIARRGGRLARGAKATGRRAARTTSQAGGRLPASAALKAENAPRGTLDKLKGMLGDIGRPISAAGKSVSDAVSSRATRAANALKGGRLEAAYKAVGRAPGAVGEGVRDLGRSTSSIRQRLKDYRAMRPLEDAAGKKILDKQMAIAAAKGAVLPTAGAAAVGGGAYLASKKMKKKAALAKLIAELQ